MSKIIPWKSPSLCIPESSPIVNHLRHDASIMTRLHILAQLSYPAPKQTILNKERPKRTLKSHTSATRTSHFIWICQTTKVRTWDRATASSLPQPLIAGFPLHSRIMSKIPKQALSKTQITYYKEVHLRWTCSARSFSCSLQPEDRTVRDYLCRYDMLF